MNAVTHLNPASLPSSPAFTQAVRVAAATDLLFIGGQNGTDATGAVVGNEAGEQAARALRNVELIVEAAGGTITDIVKWTILVTDRPAVGPGFAAFQQVWGSRPDPPAITVQIVAGPANPDHLVEVEAIAALPA